MPEGKKTKNNFNMETIKINGEKIKKYLSEGKRFDGRKPDEMRKIEIEAGISKNAEGSARVKIGKTEVLVGVKMEVAEPYPDSQDKGNLMVNAELLPLSSPRFESGPPKFPSIELARIIDRGIRESKFIQLDKLCIKEGEKVWTVMIDLYSLNDDGNLLDAAGIAAIVALKNTMVPKYDEENEKVLYGESDKKLPLSKEFIPLSLTIHKVGENLIVDPTKDEEDTSEVRLTVSGAKDTIFAMQKGESDILSMEDLDKALDLAEKVREKIILSIKEYL